jgi:PleD family two-component response regulator
LADAKLSLYAVSRSISRRELVRGSGALLELHSGEADMTPNLLAQDANRQLALFVGGGTDALAHVEPILAGRSYDVEFVDMDDEPYATVAALKPDIVVVNLQLDHEAGFRLLTMLRLDPETAQIPVLSYVQEEEMSAGSDADIDHSPMRLSSTHVTRAQRH